MPVDSEIVEDADEGAALPAGARSLDRNEFSFYGFGAGRKGEERRIRRLFIRDGEPTSTVVEDAVFVPADELANDKESRFAGGLLTANGQPVDSANLHRRGGKRVGGFAAPIAVSPEHEVDEEVIYLGFLFSHYGRVLLESLARVWLLQTVDPATQVVFNFSDAALAGTEPKVFRILEAFGIPPSRILRLDSPARLQRAIIPEPLFEQLNSAHREMTLPFREVATRLAGAIAPSRQPLYLSRRLLKSRQRPIIGEAELEDVLRENGFLVAYPETMTFEDQVRLVNAHTDIFASLGSAAHSVLFALQKPRLHLLSNDDGISANYYLCSALSEAPTTFINCLGSGRWTSPRTERKRRRDEQPDDGRVRSAVQLVGPQSAPQLVEIRTLVDYLDQHGFLTNRLRASLAGRDPLLQEEHDEAWLFMRVRKAATRAGILSGEIESEALRMAEASWPVSLVLALYYARIGNTELVNSMANRFTETVAAEANMNRLAQYHADVGMIAASIAAHCDAATVSRLEETLADRFLVESLPRDDAWSD